MRGFAQRIRARRGTNVATIAVASKLTVLFWHLLTQAEDYAHARPSLTAAKLRRLELLAGAPRRQGQRGKTTRPYRLQDVRDRGRELSAQAERAYQRLVTDWQQSGPQGAGAAPGRASPGPSGGQAARQDPAPEPALSSRSPATATVAQEAELDKPHLTSSVGRREARLPARGCWCAGWRALRRASAEPRVASVKFAPVAWVGRVGGRDRGVR
jgi:hypothetical protein